MENQYSKIKIDQNGFLTIDGEVLMEGDLIEIDMFNGSELVVGLVEDIDGEYQISLFDYEHGRLIISAGGPEAPKARIVAQRPRALPGLNKPFNSDAKAKAYYVWFLEEELIYEFFGINPDDQSYY